MDKQTLHRLLSEVREGACTVEKAVQTLKDFPSEQLDHTCIDHHRTIRTGIPEVVYGESKSSAQIRDICRAMLHKSAPVLVTRVDSQKADDITRDLPQMTYNPEARVLYHHVKSTRDKEQGGTILIICAGTSDIPVAEEAFLTADCFGNRVEKLYDVGVAGLHRLLSRQKMLHEATVIIVVAGMEGALPSVVAGLVSCPVVAVPTSVGYGASFNGIAALLGMLNSCAPGVAVVNIDNGFGAACMADAIIRTG
ncbi:nickel pincer cofactor biosynthesis protein LarB [Desulfopila sp. IMCC35008]|uniref:nickel pincer cofactor biosynthesis protein LarB n=1 Tax=Desulfopila sp. IMCC35008 TaxID=2653858 RepID=UPI0013D0DC1D|nr:nickel pincer cofactor biosynthesis protein LarB [Desulfopila sp. IMCC35008]